MKKDLQGEERSMEVTVGDEDAKRSYNTMF